MSREVPSGWQSTHLREVANQASEKWEPGDEPDATYVGLEHIGQASGMLLATGTSRELTSPKSRFQPNDVLFGKLRPNLRKTAFASFPGVSSTDIIVLRAQPEIEPRFLFYRVSAEDCFNHAVRSAAGTKMPRTTWTDLGDFEFGLPTIPEQRRIAEILSSVDEAILSTQAVIEQTLTVKQEVLEHLLSEDWDTVALAELAAAGRNNFVIGPFGSDLTIKDYRDEGVPVVFVRDLRPGRFQWKSNVYLTEPKAAALRAHSVLPDDILITKMGLPPGIAALCPKTFPRGIITADIIRLRADKDKVLPEYLVEVLNSERAKESVEGITGGQTRPKITLRDYKNIRVGLPPLNEQRRIVEMIVPFDQNEAIHQKRLDILCDVKRGLMSDLLTGRVQVSADLPMAAE